MNILEDLVNLENIKTVVVIAGGIASFFAYVMIYRYNKYKLMKEQRESEPKQMSSLSDTKVQGGEESPPISDGRRENVATAMKKPVVPPPPPPPKPKNQEVLTIKGVEYRFRLCPAGDFMMGDDGAQHKVTLSEFYMLETQVTQAMWKSVTGGSNPSHWQGDRLPVEQVTWHDCQKYINELNKLGVAPAGYRFSLPTEAQWEYACRAGTMTLYAGPNLDAMGWYNQNSGGRTHEVGQKEPNAWGLYDMHGNVWEWCLDWYATDYPGGSVTNPTGPDSGSSRVLRGGGWNRRARYCRSAYRSNSDPAYRYDRCGVRLALVRE